MTRRDFGVFFGGFTEPYKQTKVPVLLNLMPLMALPKIPFFRRDFALPGMVGDGIKLNIDKGSAL